MSDVKPVLGYYRKSYMFLGYIVGTSSLFAIGMLTVRGGLTVLPSFSRFTC